MILDEKRRKSGQALLDAALEFWNACHEEGQYGAVQWLSGSNGELIIFTRGEYRQTLMTNIDRLSCTKEVYLLGETLAEESDE